MTTVLKAQDVTVSFAGRTVLRNAQIQADSGDVVALLGPNGAGKTTLLKALYKVFDGWEALMKDGYKTLIKMRLDGLRGTPEEQAQLKKNNTILVRLIDNLNDASEEFLDAHGVGDYDYDDDDED